MLEHPWTVRTKSMSLIIRDLLAIKEQPCPRLRKHVLERPHNAFESLFAVQH